MRPHKYTPFGGRTRAVRYMCRKDPRRRMPGLLPLRTRIQAGRQWLRRCHSLSSRMLAGWNSCSEPHSRRSLLQPRAGAPSAWRSVLTPQHFGLSTMTSLCGPARRSVSWLSTCIAIAIATVPVLLADIHTVLFLQSKTSERRRTLIRFEKSVGHKLKCKGSLRSPRFPCT